MAIYEIMVHKCPPHHRNTFISFIMGMYPPTTSKILEWIKYIITHWKCTWKLHSNIWQNTRAIYILLCSHLCLDGPQCSPSYSPNAPCRWLKRHIDVIKLKPLLLLSLISQKGAFNLRMPPEPPKSPSWRKKDRSISYLKSPPRPNSKLPQKKPLDPSLSSK